MISGKIKFRLYPKGGADLPKDVPMPTLGNYEVTTDQKDVEFNFQEGAIIGKKEGNSILYEVKSRKIQIVDEDYVFPELFFKSYQDDIFNQLLTTEKIKSIPVWFDEDAFDFEYLLVLEEFKLTNSETSQIIDFMNAAFAVEHVNLHAVL